jgi:hypothetical protein
MPTEQLGLLCNNARKAATYPLLPLEFAFVDAFENGKPGFFGVRDGEWFQFRRRIERGNDFAHGLAAERAFLERRTGHRAVQSKFPAADFTVSIDQFVFVQRHTQFRT